MENKGDILAMSRTAQTYDRLFKAGRVDTEGLQRAVARGLLTAEEVDFIVKGGEVNAPAV